MLKSCFQLATRPILQKSSKKFCFAYLFIQKSVCTFALGKFTRRETDRQVTYNQTSHIMNRYKVTYQSIEDLTIKTIEVEARTESEARGTAFIQQGWEILTILSSERIS